MRKFWIILITMVAVVVGSIFTAATALAFSVTDTKQLVECTDFSEIRDIDDNGEQIVFVKRGKGLYLCDQNVQARYMVIDEEQEFEWWYDIKRIKFKDPNMTVWEIKTTSGFAGSHRKYWIIGKRKGQWGAYVTKKSLANMGGMVGAPTVFSEIVNGKFVISCCDHSFGRRKSAPYIRMEMFWDPQAEWMGLKVI